MCSCAEYTVSEMFLSEVKILKKCVQQLVTHSIASFKSLAALVDNSCFYSLGKNFESSRHRATVNPLFTPVIIKSRVSKYIKECIV